MGTKGQWKRRVTRQGEDVQQGELSVDWKLDVEKSKRYRDVTERESTSKEDLHPKKIWKTCLENLVDRISEVEETSLD